MLVIRILNIVIRKSCQNPTTPLYLQLSSPGVPFVCSCSPPGPPSAGSSPLAMRSCVVCSVASSLDCLAPSPFSWIPVWILGLSETAVGVRDLAQRFPHSSSRRLWRRLTSPPILQRKPCSSEKGALHPLHFVARRLGFEAESPADVVPEIL